MRNDTTDVLATQMNQKSQEQIQAEIDSGAFFVITIKPDYISLHRVIGEAIVQFYRWNQDAWFVKY